MADETISGLTWRGDASELDMMDAGADESTTSLAPRSGHPDVTSIHVNATIFGAC